MNNKDKVIRKERDISVELLRIVGCLIVIGVHTCLSAYVNGVYDKSRLFMSCFFADGVAIFWLIMGFFLFRSSSYKAAAKRSAKSILLPLALITVFLFYFEGFLLGGESLSQSLHASPEEYKLAFMTLLTWRNPIGSAYHLWYLYVYMLVILIFPVLKAFADYLDQDIKRAEAFMLISLALLVLNDITNNRLLSCSHDSINGLFPAAIEVLWGHIIYRYRKELTRNFSPIAGLSALFGFFLLNYVRMSIELYRGSIGETNYILYWFSSFGLLCAICMSVMAFVLGRHIIGSLSRSLILRLGKATFIIYLIHLTIAGLLGRFGISYRIDSFLGSHLGIGPAYELSINLAIIFTVFLIGLVIAELFFGLKYAICRSLRGGSHRPVSPQDP